MVMIWAFESKAITKSADFLPQYQVFTLNTHTVPLELLKSIATFRCSCQLTLLSCILSCFLNGSWSMSGLSLSLLKLLCGSLLVSNTWELYQLRFSSKVSKIPWVSGYVSSAHVSHNGWATKSIKTTWNIKWRENTKFLINFVYCLLSHVY